MTVRVTTETSELRATLLDTPAAREFAALLPLTLKLEDYAGTEKVSELPARLSTEGSPAGTAAAVGDICYYAPWGNLAIFYRDFGYSTGLIRLGSFDAGIEQLTASSGATSATFALVP
jgi:hypothetical protein